MSALVLCIGNTFRRDDGVGSAVAAALRERVDAATVVELDGEPARVVEAWDGVDRVVVVDAARSGRDPGTVERLVVDLGRGTVVPTAASTSTHGRSLGDALELGRALGRLPGRLVVFAVEGQDFSDGPGLTDLVGRAVPDVAARVVRELGPTDEQAGAEVG